MLLVGKASDDRVNAHYYFCHPDVIEPVSGIARAMILCISVKGRVGDHDGAVFILPVVPMVRQVYAGKEPWSAYGLNRQICCSAHDALRGLHQGAVKEPADNTDLISLVRIEQAEEGHRVRLAPRLIGEVAYAFECDHQTHLDAHFVKPLGVVCAAHVIGPEKGRLLR